MQDFEKAATPQQQLVITSDVDRTLVDLGRTNYDLLEFLSDAKRAGHRVIITSTLSAYKIIDSLDLTIEFARLKGCNVLDTKDFEIISKSELPSDIEIDYAFDDEPIKDQRIVYADPAVEIRVHADFSTTPFSLDALRKTWSISRGGTPQEAAASGGTPPSP